MEHVDLEQAVAHHVRPGDTVHIAMGHHRWTALARELARQHWETNPGFTLAMASLGSLSTLFFRGGLLAKVVTCYSGDSFPTFSPNPVFQRAYESGAVAVEHWSFLTFIQRLEAAARGLPAMVTGSLWGSSMARNPSYREVQTPGGAAGLVGPLVPDVTLMHAAMADDQGNLVVAPPLLDGVWGAYAARRGVIATVEAVVSDVSKFSNLVRIPAHRVLAVVEAPFGAHPGGVYPGALPIGGYGEDVAFWIEARDAARGDLDAWAQRWCLEPATHEDYLVALGRERLGALRARAHPDSWKLDDEEFPADEDRPPTAWECVATWAARELGQRIDDGHADAVLAGAGVANLAAWVAVADARNRGRDVHLTAELGLWDYTPTPADPHIFNLRAFPSATMLTDASHVLGVLVGGRGTRAIGCVGAAEVDRAGNLNTTLAGGRRFLVGSGGGNDVVSRAAETLVLTLMRPTRTPPRVGYVTSPGDRVATVVTDLGLLRRVDGELWLTAVPAGDAPLDDRVRAACYGCGWDLKVAREVEELPAPEHREVMALRNFDRRGWFLGDS